MDMKNTESKPDQGYTVGPRGVKRPKSAVSNAVHVMKLATGSAEEEYVEKAHRQPKRTTDD